jgi:hypothetical protein
MASSEPLEKSSPSVSPLQTLFTALQSQDPQSVTRALDGLGSILAEGPEKSIRESIIAAVTGVLTVRAVAIQLGNRHCY